MRRRRKDQNGEYNYWQPATDMMTGLVFVLMLIVALLGLRARYFRVLFA